MNETAGYILCILLMLGFVLFRITYKRPTLTEEEQREIDSDMKSW